MVGVGQRMLPLEVSQLHEVGEQAQRVVTLQRVEHDAQVLVRAQELHALVKHRVRTERRYRLDNKTYRQQYVSKVLC